MERVAPAVVIVAAVLLAVTPGGSGADTRSRAAHDYALSCAGCHKLDGSGSGRVPALAGLDAVLARGGGRDYLMRVPGVAQAPLSDERLAALLNWMLGRFGAAPPAPPFTAAEVGRARTNPLLDPRRTRTALE